MIRFSVSFNACASSEITHSCLNSNTLLLPTSTYTLRWTFAREESYFTCCNGNNVLAKTRQDFTSVRFYWDLSIYTTKTFCIGI